MRKRTILALALVGYVLYRKLSSTPLTERARQVAPTGGEPPEAVGGAVTDDSVDREDVPADVSEDEIGHGVDEASETLADEGDGSDGSDDQPSGDSDGPADTTAGDGDEDGDRTGGAGGSETGNGDDE